MGLFEIENLAKRVLEPFPFVKKVGKRAYQYVGYALSDEKIKSEGDVRRVTPDDGYEYYFGYYDKSPWDADDRRMIALKARRTWKSVAPAEPAELALIDTADGNKAQTIATVHAWNVQQGCMAQWLGPDFNRYILYNDFRDGKYCSVIFDTRAMREARTLPLPVYDVARDGSFALSLDFSRLHRMRPGYGYSNLPDATAGQLCPDAPCIWRMALADGNVTPLFKYTDFAAFEPDESMAGAEHKVNHLMICPDGSRFMLLHRWFKGGRKHTRLVTANTDGTGLYNLSDDGFASHSYWKSNDEILSFLRKRATGDHYYLMRDRSREYRLLWPQLRTDGHCSYAPDGGRIVTDTYPNRKRLASVYICSDAANLAQRVARVFSPLRYVGDCRCDLHPRWNRKGDRIAIDSVHEGRRGLYVIPVPEGAPAPEAGPQGAAKLSLKARLKRNKALFKVLNALKKVPYPLLSLYMILCHRLIGVDRNKVFFSSYDGKLYNDNPRAVAEALHAIAPEAKLVFRLSGKGMSAPGIPDYIRKAPRSGLKMLREMATARVIVTNAGMKIWARKFADQLYVQTWHGDRGFKKVRLDLEPKNRYYLAESKRIDVAVSGSDFATGVFKSGFAVKGEILACGCPRNDLLLKNPPEVARRTREALGIAEGARVLMYAPTFRTGTSGSVQDAGLSLEKVRATLEEATGERWVCITRGHIDSRGIRSDAQMDVSAWPEPSELLLISDLLITDYSSIGGDFMLLNRPVVFYQPDIGDYNAERGRYFDPDESPLIVAHTERALLDILSKPIDGPANCKAVLDFFGCRETGRAAEVVAERIMRALSV
ncbi:MAG: CDP-glycerol glycerophosphotransferase family protein [Clostridia bacterium]|nr:CDP-glycerol glycerophosphotransferase family protein [Clostridia bacterium]